jgi:hypothetical protein
VLSWDLHVHPGPSNVPRWGDGRRVWSAAREAGVAGFVWKSHERHTHDLCAELPPGPPHAIGSASLNPWAGVEDVAAAVESGARWVWGPTCTPDGENAWELPLPAWWDELWAELADSDRRFVLATGHLDAEGRRRFAEACAAVPHVTCSVTHSHFLTGDELRSLATTRCAFEFDCFTLTRAIPGRSAGSLPELAGLVLEAGCTAYLTSDGGQASTGDPFRFAAATLEEWRTACGDDLLLTLGRTGPVRFVEEAFPGVFG